MSGHIPWRQIRNQRNRQLREWQCPSASAQGREDRCGIYSFPPRCTIERCSEVDPITEHTRLWRDEILSPERDPMNEPQIPEHLLERASRARRAREEADKRGDEVRYKRTAWGTLPSIDGAHPGDLYYDASTDQTWRFASNGAWHLELTEPTATRPDPFIPERKPDPLDDAARIIEQFADAARALKAVADALRGKP